MTMQEAACSWVAQCIHALPLAKRLVHHDRQHRERAVLGSGHSLPSGIGCASSFARSPHEVREKGRYMTWKLTPCDQYAVQLEPGAGALVTKSGVDHGKKPLDGLTLGCGACVQPRKWALAVCSSPAPLADAGAKDSGWTVTPVQLVMPQQLGGSDAQLEPGSDQPEGCIREGARRITTGRWMVALCKTSAESLAGHEQ